MKRALLAELLALTLLAAAASAAVPLVAGQFYWSWDALNHHIYLGMAAEHPRWGLDVMPASYQTYQYPYLYWPVYRLSLWNGSGAAAGAVWAAAQASLVLPPVWLASHRLLSDAGTSLQSAFDRIAACSMALASVVVLAALATTANDLLAAVPLLWAVAISLKAPISNHRAFVAAALLGCAVAFKLSNGVFVPLLLLWWWMPRPPRVPIRRGAGLAAGALVGFCLPYAPWGWQLWKLTGNPFHPYLGGIFRTL